MIQKLNALKIMSVCARYNMAGDAYTFGDQVSTITREWAANTWGRLTNNLPVQSCSDNSAPMSSEEFFRFCGFSTYTDIDFNGKAKVLFDLGRPLPQELYGKADLLCDIGVIEHIPNCFQAMCNAVMLVKKGGILIQFVPVRSFADCYYNIQPMLLRDFYGVNGFDMLECQIYYLNPLYYGALNNNIMGHLKGMTQMGLTNPLIRLRKTMAKSVGIIRPFIPRSTQLWYLKMEKNKTQPMMSRQGDWDNINKIASLNPFEQKDAEKIENFGIPPRACVMYVGKKHLDTTPEDIRVPTQNNYPNAL